MRTPIGRNPFVVSSEFLLSRCARQSQEVLFLLVACFPRSRLPGLFIQQTSRVFLAPLAEGLAAACSGSPPSPIHWCLCGGAASCPGGGSLGPTCEAVLGRGCTIQRRLLGCLCSVAAFPAKFRPSSSALHLLFSGIITYVEARVRLFSGMMRCCCRIAEEVVPARAPPIHGAAQWGWSSASRAPPLHE